LGTFCEFIKLGMTRRSSQLVSAQPSDVKRNELSGFPNNEPRRILMKSSSVKSGIGRAPHRALFKAMGYTDEELRRPLVGIANSANDIIPGHVELDRIVSGVKAGVRVSGGTPIAFGTIGICDGIAMNHIGMKYSLASRELIADSIEVMAIAHAFDAMVMVTNCDKIVPGMLMAAVRLNLPTVVVSGGPMLAGAHHGKEIDLVSVFEAVGAVRSGTGRYRRLGMPNVRLLRRNVYRQFHELSH
jgi:dihydroxy-acid dehydratase